MSTIQTMLDQIALTTQTTSAGSATFSFSTMSMIDLDDEKDIIFPDDPIAMACARARQSEDFSFLSLDSVRINEQDRDMAAQIKKYYSDRYAMMILRGKQISEFRTKLYGLMQGVTSLKKKDIGLLYKLISFYEEDQALEKLLRQNYTAPDPETSKFGSKEIWTLTPVAKVDANRKHAEATHYFWSNAKDQLVSWPVLLKNPLWTLIKSLHQDHQSITLDAHYQPAVRHISGDLFFYRLSNPRLVF